MPPSRSSVSAALVLAVSLCSSHASAPDRPETGQTGQPAPGGTLSAFACASLPASPSVAIEAQDDSAAFKRLKDVFVAQLKARKLRIAATAALKASLYIESKRETTVQDTGRTAHPVRRLNPASRRAFFDLWSNKRDSIIGGKRPRALSVDEIRVSILIHDGSNGRCVWQGEAVHAIGARDELEIAEQLIGALAVHIGRSVRAQPVRLR